MTELFYSLPNKGKTLTALRWLQNSLPCIVTIHGIDKDNKVNVSIFCMGITREEIQKEIKKFLETS